MCAKKLITSLLLPLILMAATQLQAVKEVDMPEDFGSDAWAANNWEEALGYMKYVAKDEMLEEFAGLPAEERMAAWESFWDVMDESNRSVEHESREQYFQRVRYANEHFGSILLPGWRTEMGETWIRLGPPDWRDRHTMRGPGRDIEVWNYMGPRDAYLVFVDRTGVGDFYLANYGAMLDQVFFY